MKIPRLETRTYTCGLLELAENGMIDWEAIARSALEYMSESEVEDMARCDFDLDADEEDEEEDEDDGGDTPPRAHDRNGVPVDEGDIVEWEDPDGGAKKEGQIVKINGEILTLAFEDGGEAEVFGSEIES